VFLILGDDLLVKVRVTHWVEESKLDESEKLFKGKHWNFKLHFLADSVRCENYRMYENLEYNDLERGTLTEYLRTCNNIQILCPLDREQEYSPLQNLSVFLLTQPVLFDLQCSFSILFAEASNADLFSWFH
jgi:hypothetical protein